MSRRPGTRLKIRPDVSARRLCALQKIGYGSKAEALDVAEAMMQAGQVEPGCHITPFECERCGEWHVGNRRIVFPPGYGRRGR